LNGNGSVISVRGLRKSYGTFEAVRGISFEVHAGEVFGLLDRMAPANHHGRNPGGLRKKLGRDDCSGYDPGLQTRQIKDRSAYACSHHLPDKIKVRAALSLFATFYSRNGDIDKLLNVCNSLRSATNTIRSCLGARSSALPWRWPWSTIRSCFPGRTHHRSRPAGRLEIHGRFRSCAAPNRSILLTTHYIEEAERLCDRVAIIDEGPDH